MTVRWPSLEFVFAQCVEIGDCFIWTGPLMHGTVYIRSRGSAKVRKVKSGRRHVWEQINGTPVGEMKVITTCGERLCLNPSHLKLATPKQVLLRTIKARSFDTPQRRINIAKAKRKKAKLTEQDVAAIRASVETNLAQAARYGVSKETIRRIKAGKLWADFSNPWKGLI